MHIKSIHLTSFKGVKDGTYNFRNATSVSGANGVGKTTIATAHFWLWCDKDYGLHSNPPIRPIDAEECLPRVEEVLEIGGKEITIAKQQKRTVGKPGADGVSKISLTNSYEINSVPKSERDFKAYLSDLGVDFELFLPLSHPDVFTGQKANDMRKILFSMASDRSDKEIAYLTKGASDLAKLLENYTAEEVKAMQNATLRKIKEDYGKDGEILRAKIDGLESAKADIDVAELELGRNALKEQMAENKAKQEDIAKQYAEYQKLADSIMELKFAESDLQRKANEGLVQKKKELQAQIDEKNEYLINIGNGIQRNNREIYGYESDIESETREKKRLAELWESVNAEVFDESTTVCPTCHREFPIEKIESLRNAFEKSKAERLASIERNGWKCKQTIENAKSMALKLEECNKDNLANKEKLEREVADIEKQLSELPTSVEVCNTEEYKAIQSQIAEKEAAMQQGSSADEIRKSLRAEYEDLQEQLMEIERQIARSENNVLIDEQIAELREKQLDYEQAKADAEKILYQLDLVSRKKNELLTEEINSRFDIVRWQLFEYQKNGEYKDCCVPLIDGKRFGESTNTGRDILAQLDIIKGLQKFYGCNYPVFLDGAECLSQETKKRIEMDCQIIYLAVSECKELKVEAE